MKTSLLLVSLFFCGYTLSAQTRNPVLDINRANIWRFGFQTTPNNAPGLDFSNGSPVAINCGPSVGTGSSANSDSLGNLLLYGGYGGSGGQYQRMFNRTCVQMDNSGVVGDPNFIGMSQTNIAIPQPHSPNLIYYFSTSITLKYNLVDMNLDGGKGTVIERNVLMESNTNVKLAAVHHCNGTDIWIVGHRWLSDIFYAYLLTDTGITTTPITTQIGPMDNDVGYYQAGEIKFSGDGNKMVIIFYGSTIPPYLFDFDKSTGIISNPVTLQKDPGDDGTSFSPDNSKLYICTSRGVLVQYDMEAGSDSAITQSRKLVAQVNYDLATMQLGRDGKIYVTSASIPYSYYLDVINNPNALDTLCNFQKKAIYLNGSTCYVRGLMHTVDSYFYTGSSAYPCYGDTNAVICNDNNICTVDSPNPFGGCIFTSVSCDDYNLCTADACDSLAGCIYGTTNCDDNDSCTIDACDSLTGCFNTPIVNCIDGLSAITGNIYVHVSPNPFADKAHIKISSVLPINNTVGYQLLDALGKEVTTQISEISHGLYKIEALLSRARLNTGLYFLTINTPGNTTTVKIFIF